jgi:hypothetical protein
MGIQCLLEGADSEVLMLYYCPYSATTTTTSSFKGIMKEMIGTCGYEALDPETYERSFTKALIGTPAVLSPEPLFSVGELHNRVLARLKSFMPDPVEDPDGSSILGAEGRSKWICRQNTNKALCLRPLEQL